MILTALLLASFLVNLDTTLVNVALPDLTRELHATTTQLQWVVDAYNLVFAALILTFGSLSDRFGRKGMLLAGLAVVGTASLAGAFTTSPAQLIAARAVMGLGAAMTFPATLSLLTNVFTERRERAAAIGLWGAIAGVAIALGPIVGGWLLANFSWGSVFVAMAPVAAIALAGVAVAVPASRSPHSARPDVPGLVLSSAMMALLVFTIIEAPAYGWTAGRSLAGFAVSAVLLAVFIGAERRAPHPMLDLRLFRNLRFSAASGAVTVSFFTLLGFIFLITQYFQFVRGYSALSAGVRLLPVALAVAIGSVAGTQLAVRAGTKLIVTIGLVAMAVFYGWVAATTSATLSYGIIAVQMVLYGLGMGLSSAPATEAIMGVVNRSRAGVGSAVNDATRLIGGTLGVAVLGSIYASGYGSRLTALTPSGVPGQVTGLAHQSIGAAYVAAGGLARARPSRARAGAAARLHQRVSARSHDRGRGGGRSRGGGGDPGRRVPPRPARPAGRARPCRRACRARERSRRPAGNVRTRPPGAALMTGRITRQRDVESLTVAARWPGADKNTMVTLASRLAAASADGEGYRFFSALSDAQPDAATPLALAGFFQARLADTDAEADGALAKLDRAAAADLGLPQYFRGLALTTLPPDRFRAEQAVTDLEFVLAVRDLFPAMLLRGAFHGLARAHAALGHAEQAADAARRSGLGTAPAGTALTLGGFWANGEDGFRFTSPRILRPEPGLQVAQGYDFCDLAFITTGDGVIAIDAGTTPDRVKAALSALDLPAEGRISHLILTHAHWDHVGGAGALRGPGTRVIAQAASRPG